MITRFRILLLALALTCCGQCAFAQEGVGQKEKGIWLGGIVVDKDTFAYAYMNEITVLGKLPRHLARQYEQMTRLRYNVQRVYPYALTASEILKNVDADMARLPDKKARKEYMNAIEKQMNRRFKGELQNLTITQGQILVKLISRQTGRNCYSIIHEVKGGFNAVIWQGVALVFSNNLKREYDPTNRDRDIETIVADLETRNYYRYQAEMQARRN
jgi:hypothetical protein